MNNNVKQEQIRHEERNNNYQPSLPTIEEEKYPSQNYSYAEVKQESTHQIPQEYHPAGEIEMSGSSHSSMSITADQPKPQAIIETNQKHGIEKNVLTVCSYFYDENRKAKRKPTSRVFKNGEDVSQSDPQIQAEIRELSSLYSSELNKRNQKLKEKLLELSALNSQIASIPAEVVDATIGSFATPALAELTTVPVLYVKPVSNNPKLAQLKSALKKNSDREREIREVLGKKKLDICEIENEIGVMHFKILVSEAKVKA